jgi:sugar/nucleoside kinase (ribokinase family)
MASPFLCVYGHTNLDYIISLDKFPELNTSIDVKEKRRYFGGTAANVATIASSLGVPSALASFVGTDFPEEFRRLMERRGVDLRDLVALPDQETPTVWVVSDRQHNQIAYVYQGPMARMDTFKPRLDAAKESEWVHIMTGRPSYYLQVMKACRRLGKKIAFDPAQEIHNVWKPERFREAFAMADAFFANENELRTALSYLSLSRPEEMMAVVKLLVNTRGAEGSVIYTKDDRLEVPALKPRAIVDTTGAGDAFRAGFYAGIFRSMDLRRSALAGAAAASFIIEAQGSLTNVPTWGAVEDRIESIG